MKNMSTGTGFGNIDYTATIMSKEEAMEIFQYCCESGKLRSSPPILYTEISYVLLQTAFYRFFYLTYI